MVKARKPRASIARPSQRAYRALSKAGIKYRISHRGSRTTILGRTRPSRPLFPKARYKWLRSITY